jgi:hypothetical protein
MAAATPIWKDFGVIVKNSQSLCQAKNAKKLKQKKFNQDKSGQNLCPIFYLSELFDETVFLREDYGLNKYFSPPLTHDEERILRTEMLNGWAKFEKRHYKEGT